jgi:hypothetical protein
MKYYLAVKKEGDPTIFNDVDEPDVYYVKWNKAGTERQNTVWSHSPVQSKKDDLIKVGIEWWSQRLTEGVGEALVIE